MCDWGTGAQQFRGLVMSEIHRRLPWPYKLEFSFVGNDRRPLQKSGSRRENRNAPDSPDSSQTIPDDRGYLRLQVFISRQTLGRSGNSKIPYRPEFSRDMKTRLLKIFLSIEIVCGVASNDVVTTSVRMTSRLGAFVGYQATLNGSLKFSANNEEDDNKKPWRWKADNMVIHPLWKKKKLLLLNRERFSWCKNRELQAVQRRQQETSRPFYSFCQTLLISNVGFYRQNPKYFPRI